MPSVPPLWEGYDDKSEQDLLGLLEAKVDAALDPADPTVDERATRDFAQAIASHEWLKRREDAPSHHTELYAYARKVSTDDVGSWRPR
jgi:hypothetical protein